MDYSLISRPNTMCVTDEMVMNGRVVETNKANVLKPVLLMQKASK